MNFIIIGTPRTGSTMLCDYLNKQTDIKCHYEIFLDTGIKLSSEDSKKFSVNPHISKINFFNKQYKQKKITIEDFKIASEIVQNKLNLNRLTNPIHLIDILKKYNTKKYLGCKIFYNQIESLQNFNVIEYIKENNIKIIHLNRQNKFLQEFSYQRRKQTNIVTLGQNEQQIKQKIIFDVNLYLERSKLYDFLYKKYDQLFKENNINVLNVSYEEFSNKQKSKKIKDIVTFINEQLSFIEIPDNRLLFKKINIFSLQEQMENFDEVKVALIDDFWFRETIKQEILNN